MPHIKVDLDRRFSEIPSFICRTGLTVKIQTFLGKRLLAKSKKIINSSLIWLTVEHCLLNCCAGNLWQFPTAVCVGMWWYSHEVPSVKIPTGAWLSATAAVVRVV